MPHIDTKTGLRAGVDKNGVLVGLHWEVLRKFTDDQGNVLGESRATLPLTEEELRAHLGEALVAQAADIRSDKAERAAIKAAVKQCVSTMQDALADLRKLLGPGE